MIKYTATTLLTAVALSACVCAPQLQSAFQSIQTHVVSQNLSPIKKNLKDLNKDVENNIKSIAAQKALIEKSNTIYIEKIIEAKKILFKLEQQTRENSAK